MDDLFLDYLRNVFFNQGMSFELKKTLPGKISVAIDQETYDLYRRVRHHTKYDVPGKIRAYIAEVVREANKELDERDKPTMLHSQV